MRLNARIPDFNKFSLLESEQTEADKLAKQVEQIADGRLGEVVVVPNIAEFSRRGEPDQTSTLVGTDSYTFSLNVASGKLHSIDVWKDDAADPSMTVYAEGKDLESVLGALVNKLTTVEEEQAEPLELYVDDGDGGNDGAQLKVVKDAPDKEEKVDPEAAPHDIEPVQDRGGDGKYKYQDPDTVFDDLRMYTDMVLEGEMAAFLITGQPGTGKTYNVEQRLKKYGLKRDKDWFSFKARSTPAGLYQALYEHNGKILLFDDMDSIFKETDAINILKGALDTSEVREIAWLSARPMKGSDGKPLPKKFPFTGRVIFITNLAQKDVDDAIKTRSFILEVAMSPEDMLQYIEGLFDVVQTHERRSTKRYALDKLVENEEKNPKVQINMRTFIKCIKIVKFVSTKHGLSDDLKKKTIDRMIVQQCSYE